MTGFITSRISIAWLFILTTSMTFGKSIADDDSFYQAMKREDISAMSRLIEQVNDANIRLDDGRTALMLAAKLGASQVVETLLNNGADIHARNLNGGTALMYAAINGDLNTMKLLLNHGAEVNVDAKFNWTALMVAAAKGHTDAVLILIEHGADVNARDAYQWTPLMRATHSGYQQTVATLLAHSQVNVNEQDENGATALHHAATNGDIEIVELLLKYGAETSIKDRFELSARDRAQVSKHFSIVKLLDSSS